MPFAFESSIEGAAEIHDDEGRRSKKWKLIEEGRDARRSRKGRVTRPKVRQDEEKVRSGRSRYRWCRWPFSLPPSFRVTPLGTVVRSLFFRVASGHRVSSYKIYTTSTAHTRLEDRITREEQLRSARLLRLSMVTLPTLPLHENYSFRGHQLFRFRSKYCRSNSLSDV